MCFTIVTIEGLLFHNNNAPRDGITKGGCSVISENGTWNMELGIATIQREALGVAFLLLRWVWPYITITEDSSVTQGTF